MERPDGESSAGGLARRVEGWSGSNWSVSAWMVQHWAAEERQQGERREPEGIGRARSGSSGSVSMTLLKRVELETRETTSDE